MTTNFETLQLDDPRIPEDCREAYRQRIGAWPEPGALDDRAAVWAMAWLTATQEQDGDGWIDWGGGECPVDPETPTHVRLRDGRTSESRPVGPAWCFYWNHDGDDLDIVAYRVVKDDPRHD